MIKGALDKEGRKGLKKKQQPNHKAMDCKIILAVVHVSLSPHSLMSPHRSLPLSAPPPAHQCSQLFSTTSTGILERERERDEQKSRQQHKGNKGMFCVVF
jgi:hypothetical protein